MPPVVEKREDSEPGGGQGEHGCRAEQGERDEHAGNDAEPADARHRDRVE